VCRLLSDSKIGTNITGDILRTDVSAKTQGSSSEFSIHSCVYI